MPDVVLFKKNKEKGASKDQLLEIPINQNKTFTKFFKIYFQLYNTFENING